MPKHGWKAELSLGFTQKHNKTVLSARKQRGPLAIQRPFYPEGATCHGYVLHPPGGVVGGDQLLIAADIGEGASALLTTPGATKFYRSDNKLATQQQRFTVKSGCLEWLPQENIFFPEAHSTLTTRIELDNDAQFIGWEVQCLGRPAIDETFKPGALLFKTEVIRNNRASYIDRLHIRKDSDLQGVAGLRGMPVMATLIATPACKQTLDLSRECCAKPLQHGTAGTTLMNDVLIVRYLGSNTSEAHHLLRTIWMNIRPLINAREAVPPRIWAT